jgi:hypothetical protein
MPRWSGYGKLDTQVERDGDTGFDGVNMLLDRDKLPPGTLALSENKRLRKGIAEKRPGSTFAGDFNPTFENVILASHIYKNPNGEEVMLVATSGASYIWVLQYGKDPYKVNLDSGTVGTGLVFFCQAFDKVYLFRVMLAANTKFWDGDPAHNFVDVALVPPGTTKIPNLYSGVPFADRICLYTPYHPFAPDRDTIYRTDINNYSSYDPVYGKIRVNSGESDTITSVFPFFHGSLIVFMRHAVHMVENFGIDTQTSQRRLSDKVGSECIFMPLMVGADVIFLHDPGGFYRINEAIQEQIVVDPIPISEQIRPMIDRINWDEVKLYGCSAALNDYAYFAVPIDGATGGNNAIFVYNQVSKKWESNRDWFDDRDFRINRLHVTYYNNQKRVFAVDNAAAKIYVLYDGFEDEINGIPRPVRDKMATRGYVCGDPGSFKRFQRGLIGIRTYDPEATLITVTEGFNEVIHAVDIEKNRTKYYQHGHADFNALTDDPNLPKREDYSVDSVDEFCIEDFEDLPVGPLDFIPPTSFTFSGIKQETLEPFPIRRNGRWISIEIESNSGVCDVLGVGVEGIPIGAPMKTQA